MQLFGFTVPKENINQKYGLAFWGGFPFLYSCSRRNPTISIMLKTLHGEIADEKKLVPVSLKDLTDSFYNGDSVILTDLKSPTPIGYTRMVQLNYKTAKGADAGRVLESTTFFIGKKYRGRGYSNFLRAAIIRLKSEEILRRKMIIVGSTQNLPGIITAKKEYRNAGFDVRFCDYREFPRMASLLLYRRLRERRLTLHQLEEEYITHSDLEGILSALNFGHRSYEQLKGIKLPHMMYVSSFALARKIERLILPVNGTQNLIYKMLGSSFPL